MSHSPPLTDRWAARLLLASLAAATLLAAPLPLHSASTAATGLLTPQGSGSTTPNGDYISTTGGGLDDPYHYYIEVPPGLSRLVVEIFDADVGLGGTTEDDAGRDRQRANTGDDWDTSVTYSLFNPAGAARTTQFTTGDDTQPANSDNAWLTLFDSTGDNVRDNFGTAAYTNNDGVVNWAGNWTETNDDANAGAGLIRITGGELRINDNGAGGASTIEREANLTAAGFTTATLSFNVRTTGVEADDVMLVQVSANGGGAWTTLETFTGTVASATRSYNITTSIATNTRVRFIRSANYQQNDDFFFVDNLQIQETGIDVGHWEVRVDQSSAASAGNDINALGIRAHDGTSGSGGTELNIYYDSQNQFGVNPDPDANTRSYTVYPYLTSGCTASKNDFDFDSDSGNTGSLSFTSRTGTFTQNYASTSLSADDTWRRDTFSGWTSDSLSSGYGIWTAGLTINTYGSTSGNYTNLWMGNYQAAVNPPAANPTTNAFRVYLPTDAGAAPVKPYLDQQLTFTGCGGGNNGPNPPVVGQTSCFTVTVRMVNPTANAITFSASNLVTARIPGGGAVYGGLAQFSQGSIASQPAVNGTGNITWNPGSVAAGATALLSYTVKVTPTSAGQRIAVTSTPASGNGTRAQYVDETGNTTQTRATYLFGPLCELAVTVSVLTQAVVSDVHAWRGDAGGVRVEWQTASEVGTAGFYVYRRDRAARRWVRVNEALLTSPPDAPQGSSYRFLDEGASPAEPQIYLLEEVEASGRRRTHGPYTLAVDWRHPEDAGIRSAPMEAGFDRAPRPATRQPARVVPAGLVAGNQYGVHLTVRETGLYYLPASDVATWFGLNQSTAETLIGAGELELTRGGQPVAWKPDVSESASQRKPQAAGLFFYGEAQDGLFFNGSVYRLRRATGLRMETRPASSAPGRGNGTFAENLHLETDSFPATVLDFDPESDYWFWDFLVAGDAGAGHRTFTVDTPGASSGATTLTVALQGASDSGVANEHHVLVALNGTPLGEASWQGIVPHDATFDLPAALLHPSGNQIEITAELDAGVPYSIVYVDSFDVTYRRTLRAAADALAFTADAADAAVSGFSSAQVRLLDVTDPLRPVWMTGAAVGPDSGDPGSYLLSFAAQPGERYVASAPPGFKAPAAIRGWSKPTLLASSHRADYVVVSPASFAAAAKRLAALRAERGLATLSVTLDQVYDELNFGVPSPHALHDFLAFAHQRWSLAPRYVALAGAGSLDYRNLLGYGDCLVPPLLVQSEGGLFPSDNALADVDGDGMPETAVGRLPVLSSDDLDAYTQKLADYEETGHPEWARSVLLLSDADDGATNFAAEGDLVGAQVAGAYTRKTISLRSLPLAAAHGQLIAALARGASLFNYMGHGGLDRLAAGGLLTTADVPGLANAGRLPVLTAMTCTISRFAVPGVPSLGEALVTGASGGAIAVWGPSGLADNAHSRLLAERFYRMTSELPESPLGDRILRALREFRDLGGDGSLLHIYNLLGDPALRLPQPPTHPDAGGSTGE